MCLIQTVLNLAVVSQVFENAFDRKSLMDSRHRNRPKQSRMNRTTYPHPDNDLYPINDDSKSRFSVGRTRAMSEMQPRRKESRFDAHESSEQRRRAKSDGAHAPTHLQGRRSTFAPLFGTHHPDIGSTNKRTSAFTEVTPRTQHKCLNETL